MRSHASAFVWMIWSRHRLGLVASAIGLALMAATYPFLLPRLDHRVGLIVGSIVPVIIFAYVGNLLIFADEVGSLTTGYPRHMYTLPVRSRMLAFWPMAISIASASILWLITALLIFRPAGFDVPAVLPAIWIATMVAWFQVLCWLPLPGVLVTYLAAFGIWLFVGAPFLLLAREMVAYETLVVVGAAAMPPLYVLACLAVAHGRRGDRWSLGIDRIVAGLLGFRDRLAGRSRAFRSPAEAQLYYERTCQSGIILGLMAAQDILVFLFALLARRDNLLACYMALGVILSTPLLISGSQGGSLGRWCPIWVKRRDGLSFLAVRPMTTEALISAKYRMAWDIVWKSWVISVAFAVALVAIRRDVHVEIPLMESFLRLLPGWRGILAIAGGVPLLLLLQWRMATDNLVPAFTGRRWIGDGMVLLSTALFLGQVALAVWYSKQPWILPYVVATAAWIAVCFVVVKLVVGSFAMRAALRRKLLSGRNAAWFGALWLVAAALTIGMGAVFLPDGWPHAPRPVLITGLLSLLPAARFGLAPVVLDANRHR
ncbi:hypothetical protein [Aquisphaera insulae]|uniref:hypothetical protein n=1 Tax=Aquisphaera insulae TaxID=2712864 RepID=UPI0013EDE300|nr:hypothetical protein [Aquisphaera insulae]